MVRSKACITVKDKTDSKSENTHIPADLLATVHAGGLEKSRIRMGTRKYQVDLLTSNLEQLEIDHKLKESSQEFNLLVFTSQAISFCNDSLLKLTKKDSSNNNDQGDNHEIADDNDNLDKDLNEVQ